MKRLKYCAIAGLLLMQGCVPRSVLLHDGLSTTVVDAGSQAPIADAFVFARRDNQDQPIVLARSDENGKLSLQAEREIQFVVLLGEAIVFLKLTVCKPGYEAWELVTGSGWNADFRASQRHEVERISLVRSTSPESANCRMLRAPGE
jgi:hypothetical protein